VKIEVKGWVTPEGHAGSAARGGALRVDLAIEVAPADVRAFVNALGLTLLHRVDLRAAGEDES